LKAYLRDRASDLSYIFVSERGPFTRFGIYQLVKSLGKATGIPDLHPHTIRHSTGYALANKGLDTRLIQDYLGHRDIQSTVRYTRVNHERFRNIWR
jgi:site-specific recombinase XerD